MNGRDRILAALRGEQPDTTPVTLHNFMMAAREAGISMRRYREDPRAIADAFTRSVEEYCYDGIVVDVDTATLAGALGVPLDFPEDLPARCASPRLRTLDEVAGFELPDVGGHWRIQVWIEATRILRERLGDEVLIRGNCDQAPFSLAAAVRSMEGWMLDIADPANEPNVRALLDICTEATSQFIRLMAVSGAHVVSNGDSAAGPELISPVLYRQLAMPYEKKVVDVAHSLGLPYILHICGRTDRILDDMVATGADGLELDYKTDVLRARAALDGKAAFIGNIDPSAVLALGTPAMVEAKTGELLEVFAATPRFILNAGCAIPADTPPANVKAMIRTARCFNVAAG